jgi:putative endonuclease
MCHPEDRRDEGSCGVDAMYYVYMLTNWNNKVLYTGITNNLERRLYEHKNKLVEGFTTKYNVNKLVYYDYTSDVSSAIAREKEIKGWTRQKKNELIESVNPEWEDLSEGFRR